MQKTKIGREKSFGRARSSSRTASVKTTVYSAAILAGVIATISEMSPTTIQWWNSILVFVVVSAAVLAAASSPRWVVMVAASIATALSGLTWWALAGGSALVLTIVWSGASRRDRRVNAIAGALLMQSVVRWPSFGFFGLPTAVAGAVVVVLFIFGYRYASANTRKRVRRSTGLTAALLGILAVLAASQVLEAREQAENGTDAARRGVIQLQQANTDRAQQEFDSASDALNRAVERLDNPAVTFLRFVPVVSQNLEAVSKATDSGLAMAEVASTVAADADLAGLSGAIGGVDLAEVRRMAPILASTTTQLEESAQQLRDIDTDWVVEGLQSRIASFGTEVEELLPDARRAADAAKVLPGMLGGDEPRTYFVMFGTPAESRELGGFLGSWALITFDAGRMTLDQSARITELYELTRQLPEPVGVVNPWYLEMARPNEFPQNLPSSPDFSFVADVASQVLTTVSESEIDGFIYVDPWAVRSMLEFTGPVEIPLRDEPLSLDNAADFFFRDQYELGQRSTVFDELASVAGPVITQLMIAPLPAPEELGRVLGPAARAGRLQVVTKNDDENAFLESVLLLRSFGIQDTTDFMGIVQTNALGNKMDIYLHRSVQYTARITHELMEAQARVTLRSDVPIDAPAYTLGQGESAGDNRVLLSLYTPSILRGVTVDGQPVEHSETIEFGLQRYLVDVTVPPTGQNMVIEFDLAGAARVGTGYSLEVWHQPLVNTDDVQVSVSGEGFELSWEGLLTENVVVSEGSAEPS